MEDAFFVELTDADRLRIRLWLGRGRVDGFVIQLETWRNGWSPVARYDCVHGRPHKDILHADGRREKEWLDGTTLSALVNEAVDDMKENWRDYKRRCGYEENDKA